MFKSIPFCSVCSCCKAGALLLARRSGTLRRALAPPPRHNALRYDELILFRFDIVN